MGAGKEKSRKGTVQNRIFEGMQKMEKARFACGPFSGKAAVWTYDTYNSHVLCICRQLKNEMVVGVFNFSDEPRRHGSTWEKCRFRICSEKENVFCAISNCRAMATAGIIKPGRNKAVRGAFAAPAIAGAVKAEKSTENDLYLS